MVNGSGKCYGCKHFYRYYIKGVTTFNRTNWGWCCYRMFNTRSTEGCDKFKLKKRQERCNAFVERTLNDLLTELSTIRKVLEVEEGGEEEL